MKKKLWLILEDEFDIAEALIKHILEFKKTNKDCADDDIIWMYANVTPRKKKVARSEYTQQEEVIVNYCSKDTLKDEFMSINRPAVLLCDINLHGINESNISNEKGRLLKEALLGFLNNNEKSIISITSSEFGKQSAKDSLDPHTRRIHYLIGDKINLSHEEYREKSAKKYVEASHQFWMDYMHPQILPDDFFEEIRNYSGDNQVEVKASGFSIKNAHIGWGEEKPPVQFQNLARLLGYSTDALAQQLQLIDAEGKYLTKHPVIESLKTFGTCDSYVFSIMASIFLTWAAYRKCHPSSTKEENEIFVQAILKIRDMADDPMYNLSRYSSIVAKQSPNNNPQSLLLKSYLSFYEMMEELLKGDVKALKMIHFEINEEKGKEDIIYGIQLGNAENLRKKLSKVHQRLVNNIETAIQNENLKGEVLNEHLTSIKIIKFLICGSISDLVDDSDEDIKNLYLPFIGKEYRMEIEPSEEKNDIVFLKFCKN